MKKKNSRKKTNSNGKRVFFIRYPAKLLKPVAGFLQDRLSYLEKRKSTIDKEDPFNNVARLGDNASPDADAEEQFGHMRTSAIKEQLDRKIIQTKKALTMVKMGKYGICEDCGKMIDTDRLMVYPEATLCAKDQAKREK
jgi:RNA polymerase-binding transcription factor DksA